MRRGVGIAGLQRQAQTKQQYQQVGAALASQQLEHLQQQLQSFKTYLEDFARKYQKEIKKDPVFREHFQRMCANIGVDPLASNKGFWAELLGFGDYYYTIAVQVIEICLSTRSQNGGIMELDAIVRALRNKPNSSNITQDDVLQAIKCLKPLGSGFEVVEIGKKKMVKSVAREMNVDVARVLGVAQENGGAVSMVLLQTNLNWAPDRIQTALDSMVKDGLVWVDSQASPIQYWVPSFFLKSA